MNNSEVKYTNEHTVELILAAEQGKFTISNNELQKIGAADKGGIAQLKCYQ